jgi:hypothetical protein
MSEDGPDGVDVSHGVDVSLIDAMLAMSVEERLDLNDRAIRTILELREAMRAADEGVDDGAE